MTEDEVSQPTSRDGAFVHAGASDEVESRCIDDTVRETLEARGRSADGLVFAHRDSVAFVGDTHTATLAEREERLNSSLAPGATRSSGAGQRAVGEDPDRVRTCFEKDADRIRYSTAFRRLAGKCQVFVAPSNDHLRNRLTHALETTQVALSVARIVHLNEHLVEAIALGHDCGHGPTGHSCEEALSIYVPGGFDHAPYGADTTLAGLNLCYETLDGIRNHSWKRPAPATPEGELVSICDRISYVCHDFSDARVAGIVSENDLPSIVREYAGSTHSEQIGYFVARLAQSIARSGRVALDEEAAAVLDTYRTSNFDKIYLRPASLEQARRSVHLLRAVTEYFIDTPGHIPDVSEGVVEHPGAGTDRAAELAVRYVSGMTDRYAIHVGAERVGLRTHDLPKGA